MGKSLLLGCNGYTTIDSSFHESSERVKAEGKKRAASSTWENTSRTIDLSQKSSMSNDSQANFRGMFQDRFDRQFIPFTQPANAEKTIVNVRARYRKQPGVICISAAFTIYEDSTFFGSLAAVVDRLNFCSVKYYALKSIHAKYLLFLFHFPSYFPSLFYLQQFSNFLRNTEKPDNFSSYATQQWSLFQGRNFFVAERRFTWYQD